MKRLFVLVALALALSFATVQVGRAAPARPHPQEQKAPANKDEHRHKNVKRPDTVRQHKPAAKKRVQGPAHHTRSQLRSDGRNAPPADRRFIHRPSAYPHWPGGDAWHRRFRDWSWLSSHRAHNFAACYGRYGHPVYVSYEPLEDDYLYMLEARYGPGQYSERHYHHGVYGWCHYWFGGGNVIALFIGDDGYAQTFIWQRAEVESQAVALGIITPELQLVYGSYDDAMPPDLAAGYARDILWATVADDDT